MLYRTIISILISLAFNTSVAQVQENFQDGDFTSLPAWTGSSTDWIVNQSGQLQSANTTANSSFFISTANNFSLQTEWNFIIRLAFNPSGVNYADVYLAASSGNLLSATLTGYFVRIGNTQDEISLYRKDASGIVKLIDGTDGILNSSDNLLRIRVIRQSSSTFILQRDAGNSGNYFTEGNSVDSTYRTSQYFGILIKQSTSGFFQKHFFDDISIIPYQPDVTPPVVESVKVLSSHLLDVNFSEPVNFIQSSETANYMVSHGINHPSSAQRDASNSALVHLEFAGSFLNGTAHSLSIHGISDDWGNTIFPDSVFFIYYEAALYDVVIDEILADPSPPAGLPEAEYIEFKNTCTYPVNLKGWKVLINGSAIQLTDYLLKPDSFLILTSATNAPLFHQFGKVMGLSIFPALDNNGSRIVLMSKEGKMIHTVEYSSSWYQNPVKKDGGWSLEMIDTRHPCAGSANWKVSANASGGSPGRKNSVDGSFIDQQPPKLTRTFCTDSIKLIAYFDEIMDSISVVNPAHYKLDPYNGNISPSYIISSTEVVLNLDVPLQKGMVYNLTVNDLKDCSGNEIGAFNKVRAGLTEESTSFDIIINEILFHPKTGENDYVECYNRSNKIIDAEKIFISNRNASGLLSPKKMTDIPFAIFPGDYLVLTEDSYSLQRSYFVKNPEFIMTISSLPSFPNDKGVAVILNAQGDVLDELTYNEKWHFPLVSNTEGISLERISTQDTSSGKNNWHTASSSSGYGTPTYKNSQSTNTVALTGTFEISPKVFSPDNDGHDDFVALNYQLNEPGYVANIIIFNSKGNRVCYFQKNALLGRSGLLRWDGLDENKNELPSGFYVFIIELFNLQGKKMQWKYPVVLAR